MRLSFRTMGQRFNPAIARAVLVLALVLGDMMEQSFRQALTISGGNPSILVGSTICLVLIGMSVFSAALPFLLPRLKAWREGAQADAA